MPRGHNADPDSVSIATDIIEICDYSSNNALALLSDWPFSHWARSVCHKANQARGNAAKARLAGPHVAPIGGKEHADKRNTAKPRFAGPHAAPIGGKEHADKRNAAKARLAGPHVAPIDGKEHADKRNAAKARLAGLKKPSPSSNPK